MRRGRAGHRRVWSLAFVLGLSLYMLDDSISISYQTILDAGLSAEASEPNGLQAGHYANGQVTQLARLPVHLWQWNPAPGAYYNSMGCGAFVTAMALSVYEPERFGTYDAARLLYDGMAQVPIIGGTFEGENATAARRSGFIAATYDHGSPRDLMAAIDVGAPVILQVDPGLFGIGLHDVLLVGYRAGADGTLQEVFVDNPAMEEASRPGAGQHDQPQVPGNETITLAELGHAWIGVFTPVFQSAATEQQWRNQTRR